MSCYRSRPPFHLHLSVQHFIRLADLEAYRLDSLPVPIFLCLPSSPLGLRACPAPTLAPLSCHLSAYHSHPLNALSSLVPVAHPTAGRLAFPPKFHCLAQGFPPERPGALETMRLVQLPIPIISGKSRNNKMTKARAIWHLQSPATYYSKL